ncbi:hypothetical protein FAVG1_08602 [Fusarium avenaceum]|nr:hypothetical protein FAVG1_08602 [Fusarium avenaceum]
MPHFSNGDRSKDFRQNSVRLEPEEGEQSVPDEHTRLLPNRINSTQRLFAPDDPAVSPYNLWSIRALRHLTIVFTLVTFIWWVLLLVSPFATPPGFQHPGSGWLAYNYASLTLANLLFTLVFFGVPSKSVRMLIIFMSGILILDITLLLAVHKIRYEENCVGTISVIWALFMSLWTLFTDRMVKWGKAEEEERLTGRAETRRTLFEWFEVILSTISYAIMSMALFLITLTIILRALDAAVIPPGKLHWVDDGKYRIHVYCHGKKTDSGGNELPTVLFEGDERTVERDFWSFADIAITNGTISRYCFVDRPGYSWSDTSPSPSSAGVVADAVSEALAQAGERGHWVLASAGIGSLYSRVFSSRNGDRVKGLLLIDPLHEDLLDQVGAPGRGLLLWLHGVISPLGLDRLPGAIFLGRTSRDRVYGRSAQQEGKFIFAKLQENLVARSLTRRDVKNSRQVQDKETPLVVISSGLRVKQSSAWEKKQRDLTKLTDKLNSWDIVDEAPHEVWKTFEGREMIEKRLKELVHGSEAEDIILDGEGLQ